MPNLKVNAKISAPQNIEIPLVRADLLHVSSTFRVCFEVALSLTSTLLGYVLALSVVLPIHWVFLATTALAASAFLILSVRRQREAVLPDT
jgi:hypothetical protein